MDSRVQFGVKPVHWPGPGGSRTVWGEAGTLTWSGGKSYLFSPDSSIIISTFITSLHHTFVSIIYILQVKFEESLLS